MDRSRFAAVPVAIERSGRWLDPASSAALLPREVASECVLAPVEFHCEPGRSRGCDVAFPVLHGPYGEDGRLQGFLDLADVPYVGSGVLGSACGMDKDVMKRLFLSHGVPTLRHVAVGRDDLGRSVEEVAGRIGYPAFVKPANLGSSVGIRKASGRAELEEALLYAAEFDHKVIVEPAVTAREIECGVLGGSPPQASVPGEIRTPGGFYDYDAKYETDDAELLVPADLAPDERRTVMELAVRAFDAVGSAGLARVDFFLERGTGRVWANEVNTMPGFTSISMYPRMWARSGVPYPKLIERLIEDALARHRRNRLLRFDPR